MPDDDLEFAIERGQKLGSIGAAVLAAGAATGPVGLSFGLVAGVIGFVAQLFSMFGDNDVPDESLQRRMTAVEAELTQLKAEVRDLAVRQAVDSNAAKLRHLRGMVVRARGYADDVRRDAPTTDWLQLTRDAGALADEWLAADLDLWRWHELRTPHGGTPTEEMVTIGYDQFSTSPTLPGYYLSVCTWLLARERAFATWAREKDLLGDVERRDAHWAMLQLRPDFRQHSPKTPPQTLREHLRNRVVLLLTPRTTYAKEGRCVYDTLVENLMTDEFVGQDQPIVEEGLDRHAACSASPLWVGTPLHHKTTQEAGGEVLDRLELLLGTVRARGTLRPEGPFDPGPGVLPKTFFIRDPAGGLYRLTHPGGDTFTGLPLCSGPELWSRDVTEPYLTLTAGGGRYFYALADSRRRLVLLTYRRSGEWADPMTVSRDWDEGVVTVGGGHGVLYTWDSAGRVLWRRHLGSQDRTTTWLGPMPLPLTLAPGSRLLAAGGGSLYVVHSDGCLVLHRHADYLTGVADLDGGTTLDEAGSKRTWNEPGPLCAVGNALYRLRSDGTLLWHRWHRLPVITDKGKGRRLGVVRWSAPVVAAQNLPTVTALIPQLEFDETPIVR